MSATHRATRIWAAVLFLASVPLPADDLSERQTWESADGREITASVLELDPEAETVKMRRADGFVFTIEFEQFEAEDAQRLKAAAEKQDQASAPPQEEKPSGAKELPERLELDDVPMVRQKGNFCVPASAAMVAGFHGIDTDQDQIAYLSSAKSFGNQGTSPRDMLLAMEKLGFGGRAVYWKTAEDFHERVLPAIREALVEQGPIYVSFKPGVFGNAGHGCVIIGYHDRKEELLFHNPWGNVFEKEYGEVADEARGLVLIDPPKPAPIASEALLEKIRDLVPKFDLQLRELTDRLARKGQEHKLVWCSRRDARDDKRFAADTARDDGRTILDLAFHRNPAVLLPANNKRGETQKYLFVTRPPEGGARFLVREITADGWSEAELVTLGSLTRTWPTRIETGSGKFIWELPMIELRPDD